MIKLVIKIVENIQFLENSVGFQVYNEAREYESKVRKLSKV